MTVWREPVQGASTDYQVTIWEPSGPGHPPAGNTHTPAHTNPATHDTRSPHPRRMKTSLPARHRRLPLAERSGRKRIEVAILLDGPVSRSQTQSPWGRWQEPGCGRISTGGS